MDHKHELQTWRLSCTRNDGSLSLHFAQLQNIVEYIHKNITKWLECPGWRSTVSLLNCLTTLNNFDSLVAYTKIEKNYVWEEGQIMNYFTAL